ncbi:MULTISPECIES: type II toxin-antitoxin system RelE/ParE family toxin [unclassified Pigmentiphaga]|uniref:type II toxin-antitoxin system RelE/ParE family toxin n=1 Tax=unclassified Pigmentiphaga TaxID=2626614 RepID=UPI00104FFF90|nr:type II toxin-antitoxin system RelE/ParE family toxin [Pigmentiphaga sp. D-2]
MSKTTPLYQILWRPMAEADLESIIDYIAQDSPAEALAFGRELRDKTKARIVEILRLKHTAQMFP